MAVAVLVLSVLGTGAARAGDVESRAFRVFVDGKPAGTARMIIQRWDDGSISARCDTDITVTIVGLIKAYSYSYHGHETWKDGHLLRLDSTCTDNGKHFRVSAIAEPKGLRIIVNNEERMTKQEVWLTSYWCLPPAKSRKGTIALLDADTGKDISATLQFLGPEKRRLVGQEVTVHHYRLSGEVNIDLWYDGSERLVRQEWLEDGHRAMIELTHIEH
jgi:hypothetical protein